MPLSARVLMSFACEKLADKYMYIWFDASDALPLPSTRDCESRWVELYALWQSLGCAKYEELKRGIAADIPDSEESCRRRLRGKQPAPSAYLHNQACVGASCSGMRGAETVYQHIQASYWAAPDAAKQDILALTSTLVRSNASARLADCTADATLALLCELQGMSPPWQTHSEDEEENAKLKLELQTLWATFGCAVHRLMVHEFTDGKKPASSSERRSPLLD